jgi:hypothetical protein
MPIGRAWAHALGLCTAGASTESRGKSGNSGRSPARHSLGVIPALHAVVPALHDEVAAASASASCRAPFGERDRYRTQRDRTTGETGRAAASEVAPVSLPLPHPHAADPSTPPGQPIRRPVRPSGDAARSGSRSAGVGDRARTAGHRGHAPQGGRPQWKPVAGQGPAGPHAPTAQGGKGQHPADAATARFPNSPASVRCPWLAPR